MKRTPSPARILIVDDEAPARNRLREQLAQIQPEVPICIVGEAAHAQDALAFLAASPVDIVLLDVNMPGTHGLDLARRFLEREAPPTVIFTTAHAEHAIEAFEVDAADYLLKPVRAVRLRAALDRALARLQAPTDTAVAAAAPQHLVVTERGRVVKVPIDEVVYLRAELKYITVRTRAAEYLLEASLVQLEELVGERFVRVHRACLVARSALRGVERNPLDAAEGAGWTVLLDGVDERLPVSRRQWPVVRALLGS
jgi:two-component system response regulator AlgR